MSSKERNGFTLVELLVVIAIIGILVTIVIIAIDPVRVIRNSQDTKRRTEMNQIKTALQLYYNENKRYPATSEFGSVGTIPFTNTYMKQLPTGYPYYYGVDNNTSPTDYVVGVALNNPGAAGNDSGTATKCATDITAVGTGAGTSVNLTPATVDKPSQKPTGNSDYFVCPD